MWHKRQKPEPDDHKPFWIMGQNYIGAKLHLQRDGESKLLCGIEPPHYLGGVNRVDSDWAAQPDPDGQLCKNCKRVALKIDKNGK